MFFLRMAVRSCWIQFIILILYFFFIFINSRICDVVVWLFDGTSSMQLVDPLILTVYQLKQLLDSRGISYSGYVEKKELVQLVKDSAAVFEADVQDLPGKDRPNKIMPDVSNFKSSGEFFEQVEDTKDTIWLVQIIPVNNENNTFMNESNWKTVSNYLAQFSIKTGIYDCAVDRGLCVTKGWTLPLLLIVFPRIAEFEDKVIVASYNSTNPKFIIHWIREQMMSYIHRVNSVRQLEDEWLTASGSIFNYSDETVKVLLLTNLLNPPLFFTALSIKFTGRIKFGVFTVNRQNYKQLQKKLKINGNFSMPVYLVITRNQTFVYGRQKPQYANFKYMNVFLKVLQPEMNDVFIISLVLVNLLTCLRIFQIIENISSFETWFWDIGRIMWTAVSLNLWLLSLWVVLVGIVQWPIVNFVSHVITELLQTIVLTEAGSLLLSDCLMLARFPILFCSTFLWYVLVAFKVDRHFFPSRRRNSTGGNRGDRGTAVVNNTDDVLNADEQNWWGNGSDMQPFDLFFFDLLFTSRQLNIPEDEVENRFGEIFPRLQQHVPSFWLQAPVVPKDYIQNLPVWTFNAAEIDQEMNAIETIMDDEHHRHRRSSNLQSINRNDDDDVDVDPTTETTTASSDVMNCCAKHRPRINCKLTEKKTATVRSKFCSACSKSKRTNNNVNSNNNNNNNNNFNDVSTSANCTICLDNYKIGCWLCGLPCGHTFHQDCIRMWLERDNHNCPICRWPSYKYVA